MTANITAKADAGLRLICFFFLIPIQPIGSSKPFQFVPVGTMARQAVFVLILTSHFLQGNPQTIPRHQVSFKKKSGKTMAKTPPPPEASQAAKAYKEDRKPNYKIKDNRPVSPRGTAHCQLGFFEGRCAELADFPNLTAVLINGTTFEEATGGGTHVSDKEERAATLLQEEIQLERDRQAIVSSASGRYLDHNFLRAVRGRKRLRTRNPCYAHEKSDGYEGIFCLPAFYIIGPQKCGTTDTFERTMRHNDVVSLNPHVGEMLEPHLWTNQVQRHARAIRRTGFLIEGGCPCVRWRQRSTSGVRRTRGVWADGGALRLVGSGGRRPGP